MWWNAGMVDPGNGGPREWRHILIAHKGLEPSPIRLLMFCYILLAYLTPRFVTGSCLQMDLVGNAFEFSFNVYEWSQNSLFILMHSCFVVVSCTGVRF